MKKQFAFLLLGLCLQLLTGCPLAEGPDMYTSYSPVLMSREQLQKSIASKPPQPIVNAGKLYQYGSYILINEQYKGVHIINNANPKAPEPIGFIQVPGNLDFAVKQQVLYVDNAVDLVAIDLQDPLNIKVTKRIPNAFPALSPPDNLSYNFNMDKAPSDAVIVGWERKKMQ